jgi:ATP-dependent Clp protease ATP-binding subunit ClpA
MGPYADSVFERFTERARHSVVLAQDEARALKHNYIGTEHLLLGLLREEDGIAARALTALDVTLEDTRKQVARVVGEGDDVTPGQIPFTPRSKKVLELALREALALGHNYIGTEHVLLGLMRENEGVAAHILRDFGADADAVRDRVVGMLADLPPQRGPRFRRRRTWLYRVEEVGSLETASALNPLGAEGWELVTVIGEPGALRAVFKRPA